MKGTIKFECNGGSIDVSTNLEHVSIVDMAHLTMLMFDTIQLDVVEDMEQIAQILAMATMLKKLRLTNSTTVDMSGAMDFIAGRGDQDAEEG